MTLEIKDVRVKILAASVTGIILALLILAVRIPMQPDSVSVKVESKVPSPVSVPSTNEASKSISQIDKCISYIRETGDFPGSRSIECDGIQEDDERLPLSLKSDDIPVTLSQRNVQRVQELCQSVYTLSEESSSEEVLSAYGYCDQLGLMP